MSEDTDTQPRTARNLPATAEATPPPEPSAPPPPPAPEAWIPPALAGQPDLAGDERRLRAERRARRDHIEADHHLKTRVKHPDGGERTVADTLADEEAQRNKINHEREMGSRKHQRLPRWQRAIPKIVLVFDFALLLYFFAGITNVNWASPVSMSLAFAIALAAMVTVLSYGFLAVAGHRLRSHKNHAGTLHPDELDGLTMATSAAAMAVIAVLAVLMYLRMHTEVIDALGPRSGVTALVIPLAVAVVSAVANFLVVLIHALDGSDDVHRMDKLAAAARRRARKAHRLRRQAARRTNR